MLCVAVEHLSQQQSQLGTHRTASREERKPLLLLAKGEPCPSKGKQVHLSGSLMSCLFFLLLFLSVCFLPMNKSGKPLDLGLVSLCSMNSNR